MLQEIKVSNCMKPSIIDEVKFLICEFQVIIDSIFSFFPQKKIMIIICVIIALVILLAIIINFASWVLAEAVDHSSVVSDSPVLVDYVELTDAVLKVYICYIEWKIRPLT